MRFAVLLVGLFLAMPAWANDKPIHICPPGTEPFATSINYLQPDGTYLTTRHHLCLKPLPKEEKKADVTHQPLAETKR